MSDHHREQPTPTLYSLFGPVALRRWATVDRGVVIALWLLTTLLAGVSAAWPMLHSKAVDADIQRQVALASPVQRTLTVNLEQRMNDPNREITQRMAESGMAYHANLPDPLRQNVAPLPFTIESPGILLVQGIELPPLGFATVLELMFEEEVEERLVLIAGNVPRPREPVQLPSRVLEQVGLPANSLLPLYEIALSHRVASELQLKAGDRYLAMFEPPGDAFSSPQSRWFAIEVSGTYEVANSSGMLRPDDVVLWTESATVPIAQSRTGHQRVAIASALFAPGAYLDLMEVTSGADWNYSWSFRLMPDGIGTSNYQMITDQASGIETTKGPYSQIWPQSGDVRVATGIPTVFQHLDGELRFASPVSAFAAAGIIGTGIATLALAAVLLGHRRRSVAHLMAYRGQELQQLLRTRAVEAALIGLSAAGVGFVVAWVAIGGKWSILSMLGPAAIALSLVGIVVLVDRSIVAENQGQFRPNSFQWFDPDLRRAAIEAGICIVAGASVASLLRRGISTGPGPQGQLDPLLIAAPVLLTLAIAVVTLRIHPVLLRALAMAAGRWTQLPLFLGLRWASQRPYAEQLPHGVLQLAIATAVFSIVIASSLDGARQVKTTDATPVVAASFDGLGNADQPHRALLGNSMARSFQRAAVLAVLLAGIVILLDFSLAAEDRRKLLAVLRANGLSWRQGISLLVSCHLPGALYAVNLGIAMGLLSAAIFNRSVGTKTSASGVHWLATGGLWIVALLAVMALACIILVSERKATPAELLRQS